MRIILDLESLQKMPECIMEKQAVIITEDMERIVSSHEVIIILSASFSHSINNIRIYFSGVLPDENILVYYVPKDIDGRYGNSCQKIASILKEAFIANLRPDIVHTCSYFCNDIAITANAGLFLDNVFRSMSIHEKNHILLQNQKDNENILANYGKMDCIFTFDEETMDFFKKLLRSAVMPPMSQA